MGGHGARAHTHAHEWCAKIGRQPRGEVYSNYSASTVGLVTGDVGSRINARHFNHWFREIKRSLLPRGEGLTKRTPQWRRTAPLEIARGIFPIRFFSPSPLLFSFPCTRPRVISKELWTRHLEQPSALCRKRGPAVLIEVLSRRENRFIAGDLSTPISQNIYQRVQRSIHEGG